MTAVISRRGVLGAGAVVLGVGMAAGAPPAVAATSSRPMTDAAASAPGTDPLTPVRSMFAGREGAEFSGASPWSAHRLVLASVDDLHGGGDAENRFRLEFTTDEGARDGIYRLTQGGELVASLFLARVGGDARLEAVVDRAEGAA
ncbi:hypothetical protein ACFY5A_05285 [Microbacterium sp. NPDC012755]|uniref:hypothetical protein n=1 Tax=Microbacterium sp. NPDC012755 TaxID=3364184 RepID=UPI0036B3FA62